MGDADPKTILRVLFALSLLTSFITYLIEFIHFSNHSHVGFIFLFIFILIFIIVGAVGAIMENFIVMAVFIVGWIILVTVDAIYLHYYGALVCGCLSAALGAVYTALIFGGGGK